MDGVLVHVLVTLSTGVTRLVVSLHGKPNDESGARDDGTHNEQRHQQGCNDDDNAVGTCIGRKAYFTFPSCDLSGILDRLPVFHTTTTAGQNGLGDQNS